MSINKPSYKELEKKIKELEQLNIQNQKPKDSTDYLYQSIMDISLDAFIFMEFDGTIIDVNKVCKKITGHTQQELIGNPIGHFVHPDHTEDFVDFYAQLNKKGSVNLEIKYIHKNGEVIWIDVHAVTIIKQGKRAILAVFHNINSLKQAELELAEQQFFLQELINSLPGIFIIFDSNGKFLYWNNNFELTVECSAGEIRSKKITDFFIGEDLRNLLARIAEVYQSDYAVLEADIISTKNTAASFYFTGVKVVIKDIEYIISMGIDISEKKKLQEQLHQSQKMEAVGQLAGGVAHDFNNMLNVILGYTEIIMLETSSTNPIYQKVERIDSAAKYSANLTRQLLGFSRKQVIKPRSIEVNGILPDIGKMISRLISEDIEIHYHYGKNLWKVYLDPSQLNQLIINMTLNSKDAMPHGGIMVIDTANIIFDDAYCRDHSGFIPGEFVRISISDNGTGMDRETLSHIFEPFYTTKEPGKGTGMGLAMVYGVVKQNNGFINVYSEPGDGTTFKIYLPRWKGSEEKAEKLPVKTSLVKTGTILLVEDNELLLELTEEFLNIGGHKVLPFSSSQKAIEYCRKDNIDIHILLTDVVMPEMNGKSLSSSIKNLRPGIKTIFMSGYTANVIVHRGILEKEMNFISKPFSMDKLLSIVQEVL